MHGGRSLLVLGNWRGAQWYVTSSMSIAGSCKLHDWKRRHLEYREPVDSSSYRILKSDVRGPEPNISCLTAGDRSE